MKKNKHIISGLNINRTKKQASIDISAECGDDKLYTRNYISIENLIRDALEYNIESVSIDNFDIFN